MSKRKTQKISMQTIADAVGVARSTVSLALNGKEREGRIGEEIARKIRETAQAMNYQVNELARSLRTGITNTIALIIDDISDPFFGTLAYHIQKTAEENGYLLIIISTGEKKELLANAFKMLSTRQVDGVIMVPLSNIEDGIIEQINSDIPMVFVDRYFKTLRTSRVCINNYEVSMMATQLLMGKGCKRIAFISYRESLMHLQDRKQGYINALSANNLLNTDLICEVDYQTRQQEIVDFLKRVFALKDKIDGLFAVTGGISSLAIRCLVGMGVKLQNEVHVVAFGRVDAAAGVSIPYVKQPMEEMSKRSFDILMNRIKKRETHVIDCVVPASIVTDSL